MHNLHICKTVAQTPEDACNNVESAILEWGNENNWRHIEGCISASNVKHRAVDYEHGFIDQFNTVDDIKKVLVDTVKHDLETGKSILDGCINGNISSAYDWIGAKKYCELMYHVSKLTHIDDLDIFEDEILSYQYDEVGLTDLSWYGDDEGETYFVIINMHS